MEELTRVLEELSRRPRSPGPQPSFSKLHILKAIEIVAEKGPVSRMSLSRQLGLGEGAVRTLLSRLVRANLIKVLRSGCILTEKGEGLWAELRSRLAGKARISGVGVPLGEHGFAILVRQGARRVRLGVEQRDEAIRAGAQGAIILVYQGGRLRMPGVSEDVSVDYPDLFGEVMSALGPREGDAVVIAYADDPLTAEYGALAAALSLL